MINNLSTKVPQGLTFMAFRQDLATDFKHINEQWINAMFVLEEADKRTLDYPRQQIIDRGGQIYFAEYAGLGVVGCCALMPKSDGAFELTKMGVLEKARGIKVGEPLLQYVLQQARTLPIKRLFLLTNKKCEAAIHLYEKNGFIHDAGVMAEFGQSYQRCDVAMKYPPIWD